MVHSSIKGGLEVIEVLKRDNKGWYYQLDEFLIGIPKTVLCTIGVSVDMTEADSLRKRLGEENKIHVTITPLIIKGTANVLEDFPILLCQ
jgi:hypothetical protein